MTTQTYTAAAAQEFRCTCGHCRRVVARLYPNGTLVIDQRHDGERHTAHLMVAGTLTVAQEYGTGGCSGEPAPRRVP